MTAVAQGELFIASINEVRTKHAREMMSLNWASVDTRKRNKEIRYDWDNGQSYLRVWNDSDHGIATIWDHDVLLFAISQLVARSERGEKIQREFWFSGGDFLSFIGRSIKSRGGKAYDEIWAKLVRLNTTFVETSIRSRGGKREHQWNWISDIKQGITSDGHHRGYTIVLAEWIFQAIQDKSLVLTLDQRYFSLRGGLERWLYLWCRKAAGKQKEGWIESYESLHRKSGMDCDLREFRRKLRTIISKNNGTLLEYHLEELMILQGGRQRVSLEAVRQSHWMKANGLLLDLSNDDGK